MNLHDRERAYPIPDTECADDAECGEKALQVQAREAAIAEAAIEVAIFQFALGAASIFLIGLTAFYAHRAWVEAKRSADAALNAFEADNRTWVTIRPIDVESVTWEDGRARMVMTLEAENVGQRPAFAVVLAQDTYLGDGVGAGPRQVDGLREREILFNSESEAGDALISGETKKVVFSGPVELLPPREAVVNVSGESSRDWDNERHATLSAVCCVTYRSPNIKAIHASTCIVWINRRDGLSLRPESGDVAGENLKATFFGSKMT